MLLRFFVTVALVETVLGLLQGNNHPATTSTPDGTVLHQTLGLLVVELDKRVNDLQNKVAALESERHQYVEKNQLETALSTERLEVEALRQILQGQNASLSTILLESALQLNATSQLNSTLSSLITDHENLQSDVDHMKNVSISVIKKDVNHMEAQIRGILSHNQFLSGNLSQVQNALHNLHDHVYRDKPGFTAYLDGDFQDDGAIILPNAYSNIGSLYDTTTGVFTADQPGEYAFYMGLECHGEGLKVINLVKDDSKIAHAACFPKDDGYDYGSTFTVQRLDKGSRVWIKDSRQDTVVVKGKTTLSGFRL